MEASIKDSVITNLTSKYVISPIDNKKYCRKNGQFLRHLKSNGYDDYRHFYEDYYPLEVRKCACGNKCTFDKTKMTYKKTCGTKSCANKITSDIRAARTVKEWDNWREKYRSTMSRKTTEELTALINKRVDTGTRNSSYINSVAAREATCQKLYGDKKYNNSKQISKTKLNWTAERKELFLKRLKDSLDGKWMSDFLTKETFIKRRKLLEDRGDIVPWDKLSDWKQYNKTIRMLTEQNYRKYKSIINPNDYIRSMSDYELDHIIPIYYGFMNKIPEDIISDVKNLQMLTAHDNRKKGKSYG